MKSDEISYAPRRQTSQAHFARSEMSQFITDTDPQDVLESTKRNDADFEALKTALQSVHPFVPSIFQSEYYFISQKCLQQNSQALGLFALVLKTFSNKVVRDQAQVYAIAYEIECKLVHRSSYTSTDVVFSPFDFNLKHGFQSIQVSNNLQLEQQFSKLQISGNTQDPQLIKDIIQAHFNLNSENRTETNFQLMSVVLDKDQQLNKLGTHDVYFTIRNRLVAQCQIYVLPKLLTTPESLLKLNQSLKLNQFQVMQRFQTRQNAVECLVAPLCLELQQLQTLNALTLPTQKAKIENTDQLLEEDEKKLKESSSEFSYENQPQQQPKKTFSFIQKLFNKNEVDELQFNIQSSKQKKQIQIQTQKQFESKPKVTDYQPENVKNNELALVCVHISNGEAAVFFQQEYDGMIQTTGQQGINIMPQFIRLNAKFFNFGLKMIITKDTVDVYCDGDFLASYPMDGIYIKMLEKGVIVEVQDGGDL
ncbi:Conserved_hypothetical protein [Hexamita inflata]|uniref:Uncharacterized protein n=1 Tax=Hexamita inflata TaxID=28002 RepID=A0AA86TI22_9EUKA|nr:Conserved hypothetical protein [Hexamita inflata]